jgi:pyruvate,water dikinase
VAGVPAAARERAAAARAAVHAPPAPWIVAGRGVQAPPVGELLRGHGAGPPVTGRVARLGGSPAGAVVVADAILPGMALLLDGAAALIAEHGGPLGHGAALARELGLPHVVGARGASALRDGESVLVDGDAGLVLRLES